MSFQLCVNSIEVDGMKMQQKNTLYLHSVHKLFQIYHILGLNS